MTRFADWAGDRAHSEFFMKFRYKHDPFSRNQEWLESELGEPVSDFVKQLLDEQLIQLCPLAERLRDAHDVGSLKNLLKERGLSTIGKKDELVERLVQYSENDAFLLAEGVTKYIWTEKGKARVDQIIVAQATRVDAIKAALVIKDFAGASRMADSTSNSMNIKIEDLWKSKPEILSQLSEKELDTLRVGVATGLLLGSMEYKKFLPASIITPLRFDDDTACRMLLFHTKNTASKETFRKIGYDEIKVAVGVGCCPSCLDMQDKTYKIEEVPELPCPNCTSLRGCLCSYIPGGSTEDMVRRAIMAL